MTAKKYYWPQYYYKKNIYASPEPTLLFSLYNL